MFGTVLRLRTPDSLILEVHQASPTQGAYFAHIVKVKFTHFHLLTILTKHACHHNSLRGSRCDSSHAPTISLNLVHFQGDFGTSFRLMTQVLSRHVSSLTSDHPHYFELIRSYFLLNFHISTNPYQNKHFQACNSKCSKNKPKCPDAFPRNQVSTLSLPKY